MGNTFVKITNREIYKKLCDIEEHIMLTNGKVKLNKWIATTAFSLSTIIILVVVGIKFGGLI